MKSKGIIGHVALFPVMLRHQSHKLREEAVHPLAAQLLWPPLGIALQEVAESQEEHLELQQHHLVQALAIGLVEKHLQKRIENKLGVAI